MDDIVAEKERLGGELSSLKDDFERLNDIYETSKNNANNTGHSNDVELAKVREDYRVIKAENVFLLEKNETLFKLGKIALDNKTKEAPEVEIVSEQDEDGLDTLVASALENRKAGFSRVNPTTYAEKVNKKKDDIPAPKTRDTEEDGIKAVPQQEQPKEANKIKDDNNFCHYFSNLGHCVFEERTGKKCKFSHVKAPVCNFDGKCTRGKCMFSHTRKQPGQGQGQGFNNQNHFLGNGGQMNPFQAMAPLMEMLQNIPGMWGMQGQNRGNQRWY